MLYEEKIIKNAEGKKLVVTKTNDLKTDNEKRGTSTETHELNIDEKTINDLKLNLEEKKKMLINTQNKLRELAEKKNSLQKQPIRTAEIIRLESALQKLQLIQTHEQIRKEMLKLEEDKELQLQWITQREKTLKDL